MVNSLPLYANDPFTTSLVVPAMARYFTLSNENYLYRKKDAEERVNAVINFVNNNQECRSIQLLRYFNESSRKACGRCDVCVNHSDRFMTANEFEEVSHELMAMLHERSLTVREAVEACHCCDEEKVMEAIRWMIDDGKIHLKGDILTE